MDNQDASKAPLTIEQLQARIRELELEKAHGKGQGRVSFKVGEKGGISVYGLGRFPVTLYLSQWVSLNESMPALHEFAKDNAHLLAVKPEKAAKA